MSSQLLTGVRVSQALAQPQVAHRELTMTLLIDDPERDSITVTRSGFQVGGAPHSVAHGPPTLGAAQRRNPA